MVMDDRYIGKIVLSSSFPIRLILTINTFDIDLSFGQKSSIETSIDSQRCQDPSPRTFRDHSWTKLYLHAFEPYHSRT